MNRVLCGFILATLIIGSAGLAHAASLDAQATVVKKDIDLRGPVLGPNKNQGDLGWCFAYTLSDIVTTAVGKRISPIDIALTLTSATTRTATMKNEKKIDGGYIKKTFRVVSRAGGFCEDAAVPPVLNYYTRDAFFEGLKSGQITVASTCTAPRIQATGVELQSVSGGDEKIRRLDESLEHGRVAGLTLDIFFFLRPDLSKGHHGIISRFKDSHAVSVVGRRTVAGQVQYLVRNSWGDDCAVYSDDITCEEGNFWLTEAQIRSKVESVTFATVAAD